jgi:type IV pilus assembly protein PilA
VDRKERGFTIIELLVVILIIAILAAIAVPLFLRQREKGYATQMRSALKNASIAIESHGVEFGGYGSLNSTPQLANRLAAQGFTIPSWASVFEVRASGQSYCIRAQHSSLPTTDEWYEATYWSDGGSGGYASGRPLFTPNTCTPWP